MTMESGPFVCVVVDMVGDDEGETLYLAAGWALAEVVRRSVERGVVTRPDSG